MAAARALLLAALACAIPLPAAAQNIEHVSCPEFLSPSRHHQLSVERRFLVRDNGDQWVPDRSRPSTFSIRYDPTVQEAASPFQIERARLLANWPIGQTPSPATLEAKFRLPLETMAIPRTWIARFWQSRTVVAEISINPLVIGGSDRSVQLSGAVPASMPRTGTVEVEFLAGDDRRRLGRLVFELAGLDETDWHRARSDIRAHAATLTAARTPPPAVCTRERFR